MKVIRSLDYQIVDFDSSIGMWRLEVVRKKENYAREVLLIERFKFYDVIRSRSTTYLEDGTVI